MTTEQMVRKCFSSYIKDSTALLIARAARRFVRMEEKQKKDCELMNTGYAKSNDGLIHLISALNSEFTLCGDAFDGEATIKPVKDDPTCHAPCSPRPVTCPRCIAEIKNIRGVKIKEN